MGLALLHLKKLTKLMDFQGVHPQKCCTVISGAFSRSAFFMFSLWLPGAVPGASGTLPGTPREGEIDQLLAPRGPQEAHHDFFSPPGGARDATRSGFGRPLNSAPETSQSSQSLPDAFKSLLKASKWPFIGPTRPPSTQNWSHPDTKLTT